MCPRGDGRRNAAEQEPFNTTETMRSDEDAICSPGLCLVVYLQPAGHSCKPGKQGECPHPITCAGDHTMLSDPLFDKLLLVGCLWLCFILHKESAVEGKIFQELL
jgi:hypothetical protein